MKILSPGDPCPCRGRPLREGLSDQAMMALSRIAQYKGTMEETQRWEDEALAE